MTDLAQWYACDIDRKDLKQYMRRSDQPGLQWFGLWLLLTIATGGLAYAVVGTWSIVPAFILYSVLFSFAEPLAHECSHGSAFRTRRLNEAIRWFCALLIMKEPTMHRWMHARHHTHTIMVGDDPEIQLPRPTRAWAVLGELTKLRPTYSNVGTLIRHAMGQLPAQVRDWVPESEHAKLISGARLMICFYGAILAVAVAFGSWLPVVFFFLPRFVGGWLHAILVFTQHAGLAEDVRDHRRNTRTVYMNPLFRFLYWNMNYHIEHHLYPLVPFHALPGLHDRLKSQLPRPYNGLSEAYREMIATYRRQQRDGAYFVDPVTARSAVRGKVAA